MYIVAEIDPHFFHRRDLIWLSQARGGPPPTIKSFGAYRASVDICELRYCDNSGIHVAQIRIFKASFGGSFIINLHGSAHYGLVVFPLELGNPSVLNPDATSK